MHNNRHYEGFESEPAIIFACGEVDNYTSTLSIWMGYFGTALDYMLDCKEEIAGILHGYFYCRDWYDESPWLIEDIGLLINQMRKARINLNDESDKLNNLQKSLPPVIDDIILFLEKALQNKEKVYLLYE